MTAYSLQFREAYYTQFSIPAYLADKLTYYKRLNWSAKYFLEQWNSNISTYAAGTIRRYNNINHVAFSSGCSLGLIKHWLAKNPDLQLDLSFRKSPNMPAFVIVDFRNADKAVMQMQIATSIESAEELAHVL